MSKNYSVLASHMRHVGFIGIIFADEDREGFEFYFGFSEGAEVLDMDFHHSSVNLEVSTLRFKGRKESLAFLLITPLSIRGLTDEQSREGFLHLQKNEKEQRLAQRCGL